MAKMIQVRNVPDRLHREVARRARASGETLTQYIQKILEREVKRPPVGEVVERVRSRTPVRVDPSAASLIRDERRRGRP